MSPTGVISLAPDAVSCGGTLSVRDTLHESQWEALMNGQRNGPRRIAAISGAVALSLLALGSPAIAASGFQNCGPTLHVETRSSGSGLHQHSLNGVFYSKNVGPNGALVKKRWSSHSGNWTANPGGAAGCY